MNQKNRGGGQGLFEEKTKQKLIFWRDGFPYTALANRCLGEGGVIH